MKKWKFYILCGNTAYNRGDRGNLKSEIEMLREAYPQATITFDSFRPEQDKDWFDATVLKRTIFPSAAQRRAMKEADIIIWGGGALLADNACRTLVPYWFLMIFYAKKILRKKIYGWAHGIILDTKLGRFFAKMTLPLADKLTVRDKNSLQSIHRLGLKNFYVPQTADAGITLATANRLEGEKVLHQAGADISKKILGFSPTFWHLYYQTNDIIPYLIGKKHGLYKNRNRNILSAYQQGITNVVEQIVKRSDFDVMLVPRYPCEPWEDLSILKSVAAELNSRRVNVIVRDDYHPNTYFSIFKRFDFLISVTLHDAMFALSQGKPVFGLHYEPKGEDFFKAAGMQDYARDWEMILDPEGQKLIVDLSLKLAANWPLIAPFISENIKKLQKAARMNLDGLDQLLNSDGAQTHAP